MADRLCRAVGLDVHGVLVERAVEDVEHHPERVVTVAHENAARCYASAVERVLGLRREDVDPRGLWEAEQRAFEKVQRELKAQRRSSGGRILHHRALLEAVNLATIELYDSKFAAGILADRKYRIAREMRRFRRKAHTGVPFTANADVRELVRWVHEEYGAPVHLVTGLERTNLTTLLAACGVEEDVRAYIAKSFCANELGANKLSRRFWKKILHRLNIEAHEFIMIGNEVSIDASCTEVGIPAIIFDRGGTRKEYYRSRGATRYDIPYLELADPLPPRAAFIGFAVTIAEVRQWLVQFVTQRSLDFGTAPHVQ